MIVEPVVGNMGCVKAEGGFREALRDLTSKSGSLLIFDEVMTGFRVAYGGAQSVFGIKPDLTTLGKVIGGGLPVGAYGGRAEIMDQMLARGQGLSGRHGSAVTRWPRRPGIATLRGSPRHQSLRPTRTALDATRGGP